MVEAIETTIYPGDTVTFRSFRTKYRYCALTADRFIITIWALAPDNNSMIGEVVYRDTVSGGFSPPGDGFVTFKIKLPDNMYYTTHLPVIIDLHLFLFIFFVVLAISFFASLIPLNKIKMKNIATILRNDN